MARFGEDETNLVDLTLILFLSFDLLAAGNVLLCLFLKPAIAMAVRKHHDDFSPLNSGELSV
jgi:hypothetical protein